MCEIYSGMLMQSVIIDKICGTSTSKVFRTTTEVRVSNTVCISG